MENKIDIEAIVRARVETIAGAKMTDKEWEKLCHDKANDDLFFVMREGIKQAVYNTLYILSPDVPSSEFFKKQEQSILKQLLP